MTKISMFLGLVAITLSAAACASPTEPTEGGDPPAPSSEPAKADEKAPAVPEVANEGVSPSMRAVCRWMTCCDAADGCSGKYRCLVCD